MGAALKAFHTSTHDHECDSLVFTTDRNRARVLTKKYAPWEFESYIDIRAVRTPLYDAFADRERVVETNDELPPGAPPFYDDSAEWC